MKDVIYPLLIISLLALSGYLFFSSPDTVVKTETKTVRDTIRTVERDTVVKTVTDTVRNPEPDEVKGDTSNEPPKSRLAIRTYRRTYTQDLTDVTVSTVVRGWVSRQSVSITSRVPRVTITNRITTTKTITKTVQPRFGIGAIGSSGSLIGYGAVRLRNRFYMNAGYDVLNKSPSFGFTYYF